MHPLFLDSGRLGKVPQLLTHRSTPIVHLLQSHKQLQEQRHAALCGGSEALSAYGNVVGPRGKKGRMKTDENDNF